MEMATNKYRIIPGALLILLGIILLLGNLDVLDKADNIFWALVFLSAGVYFGLQFLRHREKWLFLILAFLFLFVGIAVIIDATNFIPNDLIGTILFWGMAAVFIYVGQRGEKFWWAFLVAGLALVLGCMVLIDSFNLLDSDYTGFVFFLGLGLTFSYLWMIRTAQNRLSWAKYPASGCFIIALIILMVSTSSVVSDLVLPALLVLFGAYLIVRSIKRKP